MEGSEPRIQGLDYELPEIPRIGKMMWRNPEAVDFDGVWQPVDVVELTAGVLIVRGVVPGEGKSEARTFWMTKEQQDAGLHAFREPYDGEIPESMVFPRR